jgi:hypothetical protein
MTEGEFTMGRKIRKVPPNWQHPKDTRGEYKPLFNENFDDAFAEWLGDFNRIQSGKLTDDERKDYPRGLCEWLQDNQAPDPEYYRPYKDEDASWFQVYETVSEGTPVTPPFATKEELVNYLATYGDFWDQKRGHGAWNRITAEKFVADGWAPSMIVTNEHIFLPRDGFPE